MLPSPSRYFDLIAEARQAEAVLAASLPAERVEAECAMNAAYERAYALEISIRDAEYSDIGNIGDKLRIAIDTAPDRADDPSWSMVRSALRDLLALGGAIGAALSGTEKMMPFGAIATGGRLHPGRSLNADTA